MAKESKAGRVPRISMDLHVDPDDRGDRRCMTYPRHRTLMTEACVEVLRRLGKLADVIEAFRVTFSPGKDGNPNSADVKIEVYFTGQKDSHKIDYQITPSLGADAWDYKVVARAIICSLE